MGNSVSGIVNTQASKAGLCPHGTIPGACPICSGMGGGGLRAGERVQKPGEMSYHECAMIGAMMRAREAQQKLHEQTLLARSEALRNFQQNLISMAEKAALFAQNVQNNIVLKPVAIIVNIVFIPALKTLTAIIDFVSNLADNIIQLKEKLIDITDKLNAIFGEAKAFINKKISELVSMVKNKFSLIFKIFKRNNTKDDETKIDEDKRIFRLKTFINKILNKEKDDSEDKPRS